MIFKRMLALSCLCAMLGTVLTLGTAAHAQMPTADRYGSGFALDDSGVPYSNRYFKGKAKDNVISLIRKPELTEDQFVLRITNPYVMNGCIDLSNYSFEAEYKDVYLDIMIDGMVVDMRDQPQYAHYQCDQQAQRPVADIVLNRQDLIKNETRQLRLHNGADTNYYDLTLTDNKVMILPNEADVALTKRFKPHQIQGRKTSLVYWFYPVGTVMLWVPGMEHDSDSLQRIRDFAKSQGLAPLESVYPEFTSPLTNKDYQYFVDTDGRFDDRKADLQDGTRIGSVSLRKKVFGLEKDEIVLDEKPVYAKLPGMYE